MPGSHSLWLTTLRSKRMTWFLTPLLARVRRSRLILTCMRCRGGILSVNDFSPSSSNLFQGACWSHALSLEPTSVEQILITTQFMAEVSFAQITHHKPTLTLLEFPKRVSVFQVGRAVKTTSGEDPMRTSEPICDSMERRTRIWMSWCPMHPSPCGGKLPCLTPSLLIVGLLLTGQC